MSDRVDLSKADLELIVDALEDAAFFRDARSRVLDSAARRSSRKFPARGQPAVEGGGPADRLKAREYTALAARLRGTRKE